MVTVRADGRGVGQREGADEHLHSRIANTLRTEIAFGQHPPGSLLATEAELRERFGVSRHTVREALRTLSELGLVERRQGSGTRIVARTEPVGYVHRLQTLSQIFEYTQETQLQIADVAIVSISGADALLIPASPGSRWIKVAGVRRMTNGGGDVSASVVFVHLRFTEALADLRQRSGPIYATIEERTGEQVIETRQEITGGALPAPAAAALGLKAKAAGIRVVRRYLDASGGPMLTAINWHQAERFAYALTLRRDS